MDRLSTPVKLLIFTLVALLLGFVVLHFTGTVSSFSGDGTGSNAATAVTESKK